MQAFLDRAVNLPDADSHQQSGLSDPYVKFSVGATVARSSVVDESLNPVRNWYQGFEGMVFVATETRLCTLRRYCDCITPLRTYVFENEKTGQIKHIL